jgi:hypothetical protein
MKKFIFFFNLILLIFIFFQKKNLKEKEKYLKDKDLIQEFENLEEKLEKELK